MESKFEMYSNEKFAKNLKYLINNSSYTPNEIEKEMLTNLGANISAKQLKKYLNGTAIPMADKLYLLADFFGVSIDSLIGRFELSEYYIEKDDPNFNKFHLDSKSRYKLSNIESETEINVLNNIISKSNLLEIFFTQLENAAAKLKTVTDNETKDDVIFLASYKVQMEIDKVFKKCLKEYMKK